MRRSLGSRWTSSRCTTSSDAAAARCTRLGPRPARPRRGEPFEWTGDGALRPTPRGVAAGDGEIPRRTTRRTVRRPGSRPGTAGHGVIRVPTPRLVRRRVRSEPGRGRGTSRVTGASATLPAALLGHRPGRLRAGRLRVHRPGLRVRLVGRHPRTGPGGPQRSAGDRAGRVARTPRSAAARRSATLEADRLIRNTYKVLLTRGMKGTMLYSTDAETREYLAGVVRAIRGLDVVYERE